MRAKTCASPGGKGSLELPCAGLLMLMVIVSGMVCLTTRRGLCCIIQHNGAAGGCLRITLLHNECQQVGVKNMYNQAAAAVLAVQDFGSCVAEVQTQYVTILRHMLVQHLHTCSAL